MTDSWNDMRKAKEESFFERKNREALERLAGKVDDNARLSPITGEPMQKVALHGVIVDRCPTSGGIWLDAGELEQLLEQLKAEDAGKEGWLVRFAKGLKT
jgi:hypothetical protein